MPLRLLTYNIERGGAGREPALAAVITRAAPDVVVLQEASNPAVVERLARATGMLASGSRRGRSLGFLSRVPIAESRWVRPRWSQHAFLELTLADTDFHIIGVHLSAVHAAWTEARRVRELRSLLAALGDHVPSRHVLVGDFNTLAPDERLDFTRLPRRLRLLVWLSGGRIRWQTIAIMLGAGYIDAYRHLHAESPGLSFPTWDPHVRLDYAFLPKALAPALTSCEIVTDAPGVNQASDHFPLSLDVQLDRSG
jgi:endonuclease/exonuclease/phosphatase family metal-dependent hydrolase